MSMDIKDLKELRIQLGLTQLTIETYLNFPMVMLSCWEREKTTPSEAVKKLMRNAFKMLLR